VGSTLPAGPDAACTAQPSYGHTAPAGKCAGGVLVSRLAATAGHRGGFVRLQVIVHRDEAASQTVRPLIGSGVDESACANDRIRAIACEEPRPLAWRSRATVGKGYDGDPDFHQLEPDGELAKPAPGDKEPHSQAGRSLRITSS
jgi:hypothetical protein